MRKYKIKGPQIAAYAFFAILLIFAAPNALAEEADESKANNPSAYLIGPEDILEISVWKNEDLSKVVRVRPDGVISLPLIGDVIAAGLSPAELQNIIIEKLKKYQNAAVVSVIVGEVNSYRVFVVGEVVRPDTYILRRKTSVIQAVAMAGGFTPFAKKNRIVLIREKGNNNGNVKKKIRIYFDDIVDAGEKYDNNLTLIPGDTLFVP
ncbi:MAG: polysaccharide export protein [Deltaproteobacteria bacterium]|nr:polysaccharide export protein [Deltaproteobacteria bacterium]